MAWVRSLVDFAPGNGTLGLACVLQRITCVLVVKNTEHEGVLTKRLQSEIVQRMRDEKDERFYMTDDALGVENPNKELLEIEGDDAASEKPEGDKAKDSDSGSDSDS